MSYSCLRIIFLLLLFVIVIPPFSVIDSFLFFKFFSILLGSIFSKFASRHIKNSIFLLLKIRPVAFCCRINIVPPKPSRIPSICSLSSPLEKCPCVRRKRLKNHKTMWGSKWLKFLCSQYRLSIRKQLRLYFGPADRS